jgi:hypothetical protein
MTITQLQQILAFALEANGDIEVMVDTSTFDESENGTIFEAKSATVQNVQGGR